MDGPRSVGDERSGRVPSAPTEEGANDFYRGGGGVAVRPYHRRPKWWPVDPDAGRPPGLLAYALASVGALDGLLAFAATWRLLGNSAVAAPLASFAGLAVGAATVLFGVYAWRRTRRAPGPA